MARRWQFGSSKNDGLALSPHRLRFPRRGTSRHSDASRPHARLPILEAFEHRVLPTFSLGAAGSYAILFEGGGSNTFDIKQGTTNTLGSGPGQGGGIGNVGIGMAGQSKVTGNSTINGRLDFSASNTAQFSSDRGNAITGGENYNVAAVTSALSTVNALNTTLGALPGMGVTISSNTTINAINGTFSASGTGYTNVRVFNVTSFSLNNGQTLTINGDPNGDSVVLNFSSNTNFHGNVVLTGGLTPDKVLFNFVGGDLSGGGPTLDLNNGGGPTNLARGIFLDPNGMINVDQTNILGRVFGGDSQDLPFNSSNITAPINIASPTLTTTPSPTTVKLSANLVTLTDSATLSGGNLPTGSITFTLFQNGGPTPVDTETVAVSGNGTYATPAGFTLPTTGTVTGTYQWDASYSGDGSNGAVSDNNAANEQVIVSAASPTISTTANPTTANLGVTLQDTAILAGGYRPTGTITFRLYAPGVDPTVGPVAYTETVSGVKGNGTYQTTTGFVSNATGVWHWVATYGGDPDDGSVASGPLDEPVTIRPQADLALAKTVSNPTPNVGNTITYTVTLTDNGPDAATNAQVTDLLPAGVTFVSANPSQGTYVPGTGLWTVGTVNVGTPQTLVILATIASPGQSTNTATISHSDQFDPVTSNDTASATVTPQQADLVLSKTVNNPTPNVGDMISFTVGLRDGGPSTATNVQVTDLLPAGLTFVSATPSQGTYNSATGVWSAGTVDVAGGLRTLVIVATVVSQDSRTNSATISHSDQFDPNTGNNTATATETPQQADLVLSKSVDNPNPNVGDTINYTITLTDNGPDSATNVQVTDLLPAGRTFVSATPSQGTYNPVNGLWTVGSVDTAAARTLRIQAQVTSDTSTVNTATITHADQFDPVLTNNTATTSTNPQQVALSVTKTVNDPTPNVGETIAYTITLANNGPSDATNVILQDMLPAGLTFVSAQPSQGTYVQGTPTSTWTVGSVANGSSAVLTIRATVVSPDPETNTVTITHSDQFDPNTGNNTANSVITPQQADLALTKTVNDPTPNVGDTVTFTVTARDAGPSAATGVTVQDLLPAGVTYVSAMPSRGSYNPVTGTWTIGNLGLLTAQTLVIQATVTSANPSTNTATIGHADQFDPNTANNTASAVVTPQQADLALAKTVSNAKPNVGGTVTYTIALTNNSPNSATNVQVTDLLPAGVTYVSNSPSQGTYLSSTGVWNVGTVTTSVPLILVLTGTVSSPNTSVNTATISRADQFDPNPSNNTGSVVVTPQQADLQLAKSVSNPTPNVGDTITYTVTLSDKGRDPATNAHVTDLLPAGLTFMSAMPSQGTYNPTTGLWAVGTVTVGAPQTLTILATVTSSSPQTNTATITAADQFDPIIANNTASVVETPQLADLVLSKTVDDPTPNVGDVITFTVTLGNSGPNNATNVQVTDLLPAGLSFVSDTPSQGTYNPTTGVWTVGTVSTTVSQTLLIRATVLGPSAQTNTATVTHSDQFDPNPGNNTATATETPQQADLVLSKSVDNPTPNVGNVITYNITLTDNGPDSATGVKVTDLLPSGRFFLSATPSQGIYNPINGVWTVGTVATTAPQTLRIEALVTSAVATVNTATITGADQFDPVTANNTATTSTNPQQVALSVTKTVNDPTPNVGETIAFTITLANNGPSDATNLTLQDVVPAGLTFVESLPSQGAYDLATSTWTVGGVANGSSAILTIRAIVMSPNPTTNFASITHSDEFDPNLGNNTASTTVTPQQADLFLTKSVDNSAPNVGNTITYTVTVGDHGPRSGTNVAVEDLLPAGVTFVSAMPSRGSYNPVTGAWTIGTVDPSTAQTLVIHATVTSPNPSRNRATISHADQFDPDTTNNTASVLVTPQQADLALAKAVSDPTPNVGDTTSYTVTLTNNGPNAATNAQVTDLLPAGLLFVSDTPSEGTYNPATGLWSVGTVNVGSPATLVIQATVISPGSQTNTATITHSDQFDPDTANDTASETQTPQQADLALTKTTSDPTPNVGDIVTYTVTLSDNGPDAATRAQVTDLLPAGVTFVSDTPSQGAYNPTTGLWTVGTVVVGSPQTLMIQAQIVSPSQSTNTATITNADQFDPNTANNTASATQTPQQADLALTKSVSNPAPNVGDTITYTITLTNSGPDPANGVQAQDVSATGVSFVMADPSQGSYDPASGIWTVGTVDVGSPATLVIQAIVTSPDPRINTATITSSDQFDPNTGNNTASAVTVPQQADLALTKTTNDPIPNVGDTVTYTVTLSDNGPDTATNAQVTDLLPAGVTYVSSMPSQGTYDPATGLWTVGAVNVGSPQTLMIVATVATANPHTNTATITHADQFDPDSGNNTASASGSPQQADLVLTKTVDNATPNVGGTITFTIAVGDLGPSDATNVSISDPLPVGLTFVSATPSQAYDPATGIWTVGTVDVGSPQTLVIVATVSTASPQTNTATIVHSDQFDPNPGNNSASVTETPQQADLALTKTTSDPTPNVGQTVTYTITLSDNGPNAATNAQVTDLLPAGVTYVSSMPSQGMYNPNTGLWTVGTVNVGSPETLVIQATLTSPDPQTNTATITSSDQFDPVTTNNTAGVVLTPQQADLALAKAVSDPTPNVGETITYTVTLSNIGPNAATSVQVTDLLPAGLTFVSAMPSRGTYNPMSGIWNVGIVTTLFPQTLIIRATVISPNSQINTANITHADQFDPVTANNTASSTETPQQADLALAKSVSNAAPNVGDTITYTVTLSNNGPDAATGVQVTDLVPTGVMFVSATPSQGTYNPATGIWSAGTVVVGSPQTLMIQAQIVSPSQSTNTATISHADQFDPNTANNTASATETPQQADLALTKSVSNPAPNVGDTITYTVALRDIGPNPASGVQVRDQLPAGVMFESSSPSQGTYDSTTGIWTVGNVTTSEQLTLGLTVIVVSPRQQTNTATISRSDQFDPNLGNNTASSIVTPQQANLTLAKTVNDPTPNVGEVVTYTLTLTNNGPDTATNVRADDGLPAGLLFVSATPSQGTYDPASGTWVVGSVTTASRPTLMIRAMVVSPTPQPNIAVITHTDQFDPSPSDNTDGVALLPQQADLALAKAISNPTPNVGDTIRYTITLTDNGPNAATNVQVTDFLPAGVTFVSAAPSQGTYNPFTGIWSAGPVNVGSPQTLMIQAQIVSPSRSTNTATISHADQFDPNPANNTASAVATPQQADLALAKAVSNPTPNVGDTITYVVTLSNGGPDPATDVQAIDALAAGLSFVSATPSQGTYNPVTGIWSLGTVNVGSQPTLIIQAQIVSPGQSTNTATITHSDQFDPNPGNNSASVTQTPQQADLAIAKSVNDPDPNVGDTITYTVTLSNNGPDSATNVQVADPLPAGFSFVSATPSQGTYDPGTGLWSVGTVQLGVPESLVILARVDSPGFETNTATIAHSDQFDPSPTSNTTSVVVLATPAIPPTVTSLQRFGYHEQPTEFVLTFSSALDPARAQDVQNYTLVPIDSRGHAGRKIRIVSAVYDPLTLTVTLHPASRVYLFGHYKLVVNGKAPSGLASPSGTLLDGQGNGKPGSDYVKVFGPSILAGPYPGFSESAFLKAVHANPVFAHSTTREPITVRHSPPKPVVAHPKTKEPITVRHSPVSAVQGKRSGSKTAKSPHARLNAKAVDAVLETMTSSHKSTNAHGKVARR